MTLHPDRAPGAAPVPAVTVMITTARGEDRIGRCLDSLAAQTLDPRRFEILVVQNGPECATPSVVHDFAARHPSLRVRMVEMSEPGLGHARNVGLQAARGTYVTYVDDDDWLTPSYLERMLAHVGDDVIPVALVGTVVEGAPAGTEPDLDNYASRSLLRMTGHRVTCDLASSALSYNAGKLMRTDLARRIRYDDSLRSGEDVVYWLTQLSLGEFTLAVVDPREALYCRSIREGSLGRQDESYDFLVTQRLECLAALEGVELTTPLVRRVATRMRNGQGGWINRYLTAHPEDHSRVAADVRRLGLREAPWTQINRGLGRDLALLYCFPPYLDTSGLVAARRLRERGVVTDVVSNNISRFRTLDRESRRVAAEVLDRHAILSTTPSFGSWSSIREFVGAAGEQVRLWQEAKGAYASVYSRSMAVASHFAAALLKLEQPEIRWVAEFSDPLKFHPNATERSSQMEDDDLSARLHDAISDRGHALPDTGLFEFAELMVYALADELIFTNEQQRRLMLSYCRVPSLADRAQRRSEISHHPTLPADFYDLSPIEYELQDEVVHLAYFGVFYVTRGLEEVLAAVEGLSALERRRMRLHVFTSRPEDLRLEAVAAGLSDVLVVRPFMPFLQFLSAMTAFDALLVKDARAIEHFGLNPYLPSKISDYRGSGTPVWAITEPGSPLDGIETAHRSAVGDVEGARRVLRALITERPQHDRPVDGVDDIPATRPES